MGLRGRHGTPGSETKYSLLITAIAIVRVSPFLHQLPEPVSSGQRGAGPITSAPPVGGITGDDQ